MIHRCLLNPFTLRVTLKSIVCYSHTFENDLEIKQNGTKYFKESCCLASHQHFSIKCFAGKSKRKGPPGDGAIAEEKERIQFALPCLSYCECGVGGDFICHSFPAIPLSRPVTVIRPIEFSCQLILSRTIRKAPSIICSMSSGSENEDTCPGIRVSFLSFSQMRVISANKAYGPRVIKAYYPYWLCLLS